MYRKLHFKIVLILVSFIICIMTVVGTILIGNVFTYYTNEFVSQQSSVFTNDFVGELEKTLEYENYPERLKNTLYAYSTRLGIDANRNYFVLDADGNYLSGSVEEKDANIKKTRNLVRAISGVSSHQQKVGNASSDWAEVLTSPTDPDLRVIVYINDDNTEMNSFSWMIFTIILQSLLIGLIIAIILSFFLSKAIVSPIQNITKKASRLSKGDFDESLQVYSDDEIGNLTVTFNKMADTLKNNMTEISNQREKLETIIHYLKDAVIAFDSEGRAMHINHEATELLGVESGKDITLDTLIETLDLDCRAEDLSVENDSLVLTNVIFKNKVFDISFGKFNFNLSDLTFGGYIAVLHDVTESFELDKSRREFIATVSHELGTPLTSIKGATETVISNPDMPDEVKSHFLDMVISESDRMTHIVHDLLVLSRLDNNRVKFNTTSFSVVELIEKCRMVLLQEAEKASQTLTYVKNDDLLPEMVADREKVEQILINIVQNALKYTQDGGKIFIFSSLVEGEGIEGLKARRYFKLSVTDNGQGIPEEDLPHIFERFYRVEKARSSDKGGTGLGLAIARELTVAHGGNILISSTFGKGTTVDIYLPQSSDIQ